MARTKEFDESVILSKAVNLFWTKGYNGTSAQDLVDYLGISRSSLYDTYGDKHTLFLKALLYYREKVTGTLLESINKSEDPEQAIKNIFQMAVADALQDKAAKGCFMVNASIELAAHDKEIANIISENSKNIEDAFYRAIKKGQEKRQFTNTLPARSLAKFLFNSLIGMRVLAKADTEKKVFDDIVKVTLSVLHQKTTSV